MAVQGVPREFHRKWKFVIQIDGVDYAGFQTCSELRSELAVHSHHEGGSSIPNKMSGRRTYPDITLTRGATTNDADLYNWHEQCTEAAEAAGAVEPSYKRTLDIVQQDLANNTVKRFRVFGAWPSVFSAGDWDNEADENVIESVTLAIDYWLPV